MGTKDAKAGRESNPSSATAPVNVVSKKGINPQGTSGTMVSTQHKGTLRAAQGLQIKRFFTHPGEDIYGQMEWVQRSSIITEPDGRVVFKQDNVEVPSTWS